MTARETIVPVRVKEDELKLIDKMARHLGLSRSAAIRLAAMQRASELGFKLDESKRE